MIAEDTAARPATLNVDALWLLQALMGVARLAPELRARPYAAARSDDWLGRHPGVDSLREAGLVDAAGAVVPELASRMDVLAVPDVEAVLLVSRGPLVWEPERASDPATWRAVPDEQLRVVLARRNGRWVSAARAGDDITIDTVSPELGAGEPAWLAQTMVSLLDSAHVSEPSRIAPINVPAAQLISATGSAGRGITSTLRDLGVRGAALAELAETFEHPAAEAVFYARVFDDTHTRSSAGAVDVRASDAGRVVTYQLATVRGSGQQWMAIAPATLTQVEAGIKAVLAGLNVRNWASHTRF
ncbi:MAG: hypothetical protein QG597_3786 [Actinomycetota bacterium]|nr:hypothetical protein [Actinomycetota bacterium]